MAQPCLLPSLLSSSPLLWFTLKSAFSFFVFPQTSVEGLSLLACQSFFSAQRVCDRKPLSEFTACCSSCLPETHTGVGRFPLGLTFHDTESACGLRDTAQSEATAGRSCEHLAHCMNQCNLLHSLFGGLRGEPSYSCTLGFRMVLCYQGCRCL